MQANEDARHRSAGLRFFAAILGALLLSWDASAVDETEVAVTARAESAASDLAGSLRSLSSSLRSAQPSTKPPEEFTAADNDAQIEAGAKIQIAEMAEQLDLLAAMLGAGADRDETKALVQSLTQRAATLSRLGQRTSQPLLPTEQHQALLKLWGDVEMLSASRSAALTPSADAAAEAVPPE
jgi:hypothetical protein